MTVGDQLYIIITYSYKDNLNLTGALKPNGKFTYINTMFYLPMYARSLPVYLGI